MSGTAPVILNTEPHDYSPEARDILLSCGRLHEEECTKQRLHELIGGCDVLVARFRHRLDEGLLRRATNLKVIVSPTTGLDHIDRRAASARGIRLLSLRGERKFLDRVTATAELTWGLLLALARRLPEVESHVAGGRWERDEVKGMELKGKTMGIIGYGRLGSMVARYARAFRMRVAACDPHVTQVPSWVSLLPLEEVVGMADAVSLHLPLTEETEGMFGRKLFGRMKKGAIFINTSRGGIVSERALCAALESGRLQGAAVDVLRGETGRRKGWLEKNPLWQYAREHANLIITPHVGGATKESMHAVEIFMARKLKGFIRRNPKLFPKKEGGAT